MKILQMFGSVTFVSKFVSTHMALKWSLSRVSPVVILQFTAGLKVLFTHITDEPAFSRVNLLMSLQQIGTIKCASTAWELTRELV